MRPLWKDAPVKGGEGTFKEAFKGTVAALGVEFNLYWKAKSLSEF